jgi:hypothetical protein
MADFVQVNAAGKTVIYDLASRVVVGGAGLTVVYGIEPEEGFVQADAAGLMAIYQENLPPRRIFPAPSPKVRWQSHPNIRKFPTVS